MGRWEPPRYSEPRKEAIRGRQGYLAEQVPLGGWAAAVEVLARLEGVGQARMVDVAARIAFERVAVAAVDVSTSLHTRLEI